MNPVHVLIGVAIVIFARLTNVPWWWAPVGTLWTGLVHGWTEYYEKRRTNAAAHFEWWDDVITFLPGPVLDLMVRALVWL